MNTVHLLPATDWKDYALLDSGDGEKLERYGEYILRRPDPQILWSKSLTEQQWKAADATFEKTYSDKGVWSTRTRLPESWPVHWQDLTAHVRLAPFKHTGVFPEQSAHWAWMRELLQQKKSSQPAFQPHILNLFAYTGMASVVCASAGAKVTHVDASRSSITWAKQNQLSSGLDERSIRWILDDVMKFVQREVKRGTKYDGIIMDPPIYGHGPSGETWDFKISFPQLLEQCQHILSDHPLFVVINAYAISTSALTLGNVLQETLQRYEGIMETGELVLEETNAVKRMLSTGIYARWRGK